MSMLKLFHCGIGINLLYPIVLIRRLNLYANVASSLLSPRPRG